MAESFWFYAFQGGRHGPVPLAEIRSRAAGGLLTAEDMVWTEGMASWTRAGSIPGLLGPTPAPAPSAPPASTPPAPVPPLPAQPAAAPLAPGAPAPPAPDVVAPAPPAPDVVAPDVVAPDVVAPDKPHAKAVVDPLRLEIPPSRPKPSSRLTSKSIFVVALAVVLVGMAWFVFRPSSRGSDEDVPATEHSAPSPSGEAPDPQSAAPSGQTTAPPEPSADQQRQQKTVEEIRRLGTAYMAWLKDQRKSTGRKHAQVAVEEYKYGRLGMAEIADDLKSLEPDSFYIDEIPSEDGWGHPIEVWRGETLHEDRVLLIRSPGRDGIFDGEEYVQKILRDSNYDVDIVWADGHFIQWPAEPQ